MQESMAEMMECVSLGYFGKSNINSAAKHADRLKALMNHSGPFVGIPQDEFALDVYPPSLEQYVSKTLSRWDALREKFEWLENHSEARTTGKGTVLQEVLWQISDLNFLINRLYVFQKTGKLPRGSYKPPFHIFKEEKVA
jgi:hypothetical protein